MRSPTVQTGSNCVWSSCHDSSPMTIFHSYPSVVTHNMHSLHWDKCMWVRCLAANICVCIRVCVCVCVRAHIFYSSVSSHLSVYMLPKKKKQFIFRVYDSIRAVLVFFFYSHYYAYVCQYIDTMLINVSKNESVHVIHVFISFFYFVFFCFSFWQMEKDDYILCVYVMRFWAGRSLNWILAMMEYEHLWKETRKNWSTSDVVLLVQILAQTKKNTKKIIVQLFSSCASPFCCSHSPLDSSTYNTFFPRKRERDTFNENSTKTLSIPWWRRFFHGSIVAPCDTACQLLSLIIWIISISEKICPAINCDHELRRYLCHTYIFILFFFITWHWSGTIDTKTYRLKSLMHDNITPSFFWSFLFR